MGSDTSPTPAATDPGGYGASPVTIAISRTIDLPTERSIVIDGQFPAAVPFMTAAAVACCLAASGWGMYRSMEGRFAERV